jgi:hypothetical protein
MYLKLKVLIEDYAILSCSRGSKDLSKSGWLQQWDVNSTEKLTGNKISIVSKDEKWIVNTVVDGQIAYFLITGKHSWMHSCFTSYCAQFETRRIIYHYRVNYFYSSINIQHEL